MSCDCSAPEDIFVIGCTALSGVSFPDGVAVPVVLCQCGWSFDRTGRLYFTCGGCGAVPKWQEMVVSTYYFLSEYSHILFEPQQN